MDDYESLSPAKWAANIPRGVHPPVPQEVVYGELRQYFGEVFRRLALQKESRIEQGHSCRITSATPTAASSGPISKAPGFAGGYLPAPVNGGRVDEIPEPQRRSVNA